VGLAAQHRHVVAARDIAVVGAGPAGLMAAEVLAGAGLAVTVYDHMPSAGRKFLMAGRGGLNLTHSEPLTALLARYGDAASALTPAIEAFTPTDLVSWANGLGIETFIGSSGRVFPKALKASPLLRAWLRRLEALGVTFRFRHRWIGWRSDGALLFRASDGNEIDTTPAATLIAVGGASWPRLGSDGTAFGILSEAGIETAPLQPANCGALIDWSDKIKEKFQGAPLKRIAATVSGCAVKGEAVVTRAGLEGGAIYQQSPRLRRDIARDGRATLVLDLRPEAAEPKLAERLSAPRGKQSLANVLRKSANISPVAIALLHESTRWPGLQSSEAGGAALRDMTPLALARRIKSLALPVHGLAGLDRAISTAGGVSFDAIDPAFMLAARPGIFVAGEMLDWEAPTGGYLLQACFSTAVAAAHGILAHLDR